MCVWCLPLQGRRPKGRKREEGKWERRNGVEIRRRQEWGEAQQDGRVLLSLRRGGTRGAQDFEATACLFSTAVLCITAGLLL